MPTTNVQKQKSKLYNSTTKFKFLQSVGGGLGLILTHSWLESLGWDNSTPLVISIEPFDEIITIRKLNDPSIVVKKNEKAGKSIAE